MQKLKITPRRKDRIHFEGRNIPARTTKPQMTHTFPEKRCVLYHTVSFAKVHGVFYAECIIEFNFWHTVSNDDKQKSQQGEHNEIRIDGFLDDSLQLKSSQG